MRQSATKPLTAFFEADIATDLDQKSTIGALHTYLCAHSSWSIQKQSTSALSTCGAKYVSPSFRLQDTLWLCCLLAKIFLNKPQRYTSFYIANTSTIQIVQDNRKTKRWKHIDIKTHSLSHYHRVGNIYVHHIPTDDSVADVLSKSHSFRNDPAPLPITSLIRHQLLHDRSKRQDISVYPGSSSLCFSLSFTNPI